MSNGPIYKPKGRAAEFSLLALNHYVGCFHGCSYCYVPKCLHVTQREFHNHQRVKPNVLEKLRQQAPKFAGTDKRVLLCFSCDPYQLLDSGTKTTRKVIEILREFDIPFQVLTKAGLNAIRDFDLYGKHDAFATTMTFLLAKSSFEWEPRAVFPSNRLCAIREAHERGIETWISLEPVLDAEQSLEIIRQTHEFVDLYKIGKLNYQEPPQPIDWRTFGMDAIQLCIDFCKPYFIKADLAKYLDGVIFRNTDNRRVKWRVDD